MRAALAIRRRGVERAIGRGGYDLAFAVALYGSELMSGGWAAEGVAYLRVAEAMSREWRNSLARDVIALTLATGLGLRGRIDEAEAVLATVDRARNPTDGQRSAILFGTEAAIRWGGGQPRAAVGLYQAALAASLQSRNRQLPVIVYNNLAGAQLLAGDLADAEESIRAGESRVQRGGQLEAHLFGTRAEVELARGNLEAAQAALGRSKGIKERVGALGGLGWTLGMEAQLAAASGDQERARRLLAESAPILQAVEALRGWQAAAQAVGESTDGVVLVEAAPDELLERARHSAKPVPARTEQVQRVIPTVIGAGLGLAAGWLILGLLGGLVALGQALLGR
jgi:ATP/maltotriose-dependent transcriptional regulator MalT